MASTDNVTPDLADPPQEQSQEGFTDDIDLGMFTDLQRGYWLCFTEMAHLFDDLASIHRHSDDACDYALKSRDIILSERDLMVAAIKEEGFHDDHSD